MNIKYIDVHSHPHFSAFDEDRSDVLERMQKEKVGAIAVGTGKKTSKSAVELAKENSFIWSCVGQHPTENEEFNQEFYRELLKEKKQNKIVAIGECGLDYFRMDATEKQERERQKKLFENQIQLAIEYSLPLMLHIRSNVADDAHKDAYEILKSYKKQYPKLHLHMHFFTADTSVAKFFLELDASFGIPGVVTFAKSVTEMVENLPDDKILVESDAPYATPTPYRGKRNEPVYILSTIEKISRIKNKNFDEMAEIILKNSLKYFAIEI